MSTVIKVENVSKQYRLGQVGTGALSHDINRWWHKLRGKDDPYLKVGETNDRTIKGTSEYVWALKDVNFEVNQGEVLGIIGRNGAGKSTLLKILSRTTLPTTGSVKAKGRIASLLEVGTGFHPELSGRENIFLNGAILGMTRTEIKNKFDEIVDFAGVERYIDTPVKRYSSGMYVRLAFGVAAHLESEILIVDEVLAVGDAEFQTKCLGKMNEMSKKDHRTVLFVSHNMGVIAELCNRGVYMENGKVVYTGNISDTITHYISQKGSNSLLENSKELDQTKFLTVCLGSLAEQKRLFSFSDKIEVVFNIFIKEEVKGDLTLSFIVRDKLERPVFASHFLLKGNTGEMTIKAIIPSQLLLPGTYYIEPLLHIPNLAVVNNFNDMLSFDIEDTKTEHSLYTNADIGKINVDVNWIY